MRKWNRLLAAALMALCLLATGCSQLFGMHDRPTPTVKPSPTATATATPAATRTATPTRMETLSPTPTDQPTPTATATLVPLPRDLTEVARFEVDIDADGDKETVVVAMKDVDYGSTMVGVVGTDAIVWAADQGQKGSFAYAYLAAAPNGAPCVLASVDVGSDDYVTSLYAFSNGKPVLKDELWENVVEVNGSAVTVRDDLYVIGSWMFTCEYRITAAFKFERVSEMMLDMEYREPMHTVRPLPVEMLVSGVYTAQTLPVGSRLTPIATDGETYMSFTLADGREGRILFTMHEWQAYIDGVLSDEYFDNLEYWD